MNASQQKLKNWLISKVNKPEDLTALDMKLIDFCITIVPDFVMMLATFGILSAIYLWVLGKYGFEKTLIVLLINMIMVVGQVSGYLKRMTDI
jgi:hypothetical protein